MVVCPLRVSYTIEITIAVSVSSQPSATISLLLTQNSPSSNFVSAMPHIMFVSLVVVMFIMKLSERHLNAFTDKFHIFNLKQKITV